MLAPPQEAEEAREAMLQAEAEQREALEATAKAAQEQAVGGSLPGHLQIECVQTVQLGCASREAAVYVVVCVERIGDSQG